MLVIFCLGFSSGLPLALVGGTLQAWFKTSGASVVTLGFMTLLGQPHSYKFLWAPLLDRFAPFSALDLRRGWILTCQLAITLLILLMSVSNPLVTVNLFALQIPVLLMLGFLLSICSASQDIAIDAYRIAVLDDDERGLGTGLGIEGYRVAMVVSGGCAMVLADHYSWQLAYIVMSVLMLIGIIATMFAPAIDMDTVSMDPPKLQVVVKRSIMDLWQRKQAGYIIALLLTYKLGDAFSHVLSTPFLQHLNFTLTEVGMINKTLGVAATLLGIFVGGVCMTRLSLSRALLLFGILACVTNLTYMLLAMIGKNFIVACVAVLVENICAGMGTAAFTAFLMSLCNPAYTATQYAFLSSLAVFGRIYVGPIAGYFVEYCGWELFYAFSAIVALPGLGLVLITRKQIDQKRGTQVSLVVEMEQLSVVSR